MMTGGIEKRGEQNQHFVFHEEGPKAPFDAEGIKGGVCAADGAIKKIRAKKGKKAPLPLCMTAGNFQMQIISNFLPKSIDTPRAMC